MADVRFDINKCGERNELWIYVSMNLTRLPFV